MKLSILIVDDNADKAQTVANGLAARLPSIELEIVTVADSISAKRVLEKRAFKAMILDVALPLRAGDKPMRKGGIDLLKEIFSREVFHRPLHIIGLTAFTDIYETEADEFSSELWSLLLFDPSSEVWLERLANRMRHIALAETETNQHTEHCIDVCILTALPDEFLQIKRIGWKWSAHEQAGDPTNYIKATFVDADGVTRTAVAAHAPLMGMSAASILATKMGFHFRPRFMIMAGICAGDSNQVKLGDVIAASLVWDYGSGKHVSSSADTGHFEPAPFQVPMSSTLRGAIERIASNTGKLFEIREAYTAPKPGNTLDIHIGPLASGAAVVADKEVFNQIQARQHRKLIGLDMEAYGVMSAASELPAPQPKCAVIKSVSDFADKEKSDKCRDYAAYVSAQVVRLLCEQLPKS